MCYRKNKNLPYDVIIGRDLMEELQIDVLYSEDVVVLDGIIMPMQKIQNGRWPDLNLMNQEDPEANKEHSIWLRRIFDANYKKADLRQEVIKLIHLT